MAKYVKFVRGTPTAYKNLAVKDNDTLYFIYEEDVASAELYLGSKLISGNGDGSSSSITSLGDLKDVLLSANLIDDSVLMYDSASAAWVNKPLENLVFVGATSESAGVAGLVPAPKLNQTDLFLKSDGTWGTPYTDHTVLTLENTDQSVHTDLIANATDESSSSGDIIIIKDLISEGKWQYTAYVYDNNDWHAMDGNYNAENVYFSEDLVTTTAIGNITLTDGQATIAAAGKNLKEVFDTIFVKEKNPSTVKPAVSLTFSQEKGYEVGSLVTPSYIASLSTGSYTYGPATGIVASSWSVIDSDGNTSTKYQDSFPEVKITDETQYSITATANYPAGTIPVTNLGNEYPSGQISSGSASKTSGLMTGYRNSFYGVLTDKETLTSDKIRSLSKSNKALVNSSSITFNIPLGAMRVVIAYPSNLRDLSSVTDKNGLNAEISSGFTKELLDIEGNNNYDAIEYKVYVLDYANANDTDNYYTFTI